MTKTWQSLSPREKAAAEQVFDALSTFDALTGGIPEATPAREAVAQGARRFAFQDLHAYATRRAGADDALIEGALARDGGLRASFHRLLENIALCFLARPAEASSGEVESREGAGFTIALTRSKADSGHTYVTVRLTAPGISAPKALFAFGGETRHRKFSLPEAEDGVIQVLAESDSELVQTLRDNKTEIFLN